MPAVLPLIWRLHPGIWPYNARGISFCTRFGRASVGAGAAGKYKERDMHRKIEKVGVMGSGVMGSAIAAHFANVGIDCLLLDLPPKEGDDPNALAKAGLVSAQKAKPAAFYLPAFSERIEIGNFDSDLERVKECDWLVEVIVERMDIKKSFLERLDKVRKPGTIVTSNTSGLSVNEMVSGCSEDMRKHFMGMHFFNPPRYLKLLEVIPTKDTDPEVVAFVSKFGEDILGKGVVLCKDTPNFIANRIGVYAMMSAMQLMVEDGYTVEEIDNFTGRNIGRQKSATFRTADLVGLDVLAHVANNLYEGLAEDDERDMFKIPEFLSKLIESGALGAKAKKGFYVKTPEREIKQLDIKTGEYVSQEKPRFSSIGAARNLATVPEKVKAIVGGKDKASEFLWKNFSAMFLYSAKRIPEIADTVVEIDNALKWGFGWTLGPFETWDALGVPETVARMKEEGRAIPDLITKFLEAGNESFYKSEKGVDSYYDFRDNAYKPIARDPRIVILKNKKEQAKTILSNSGATLIDLDDGIACLEFHTKMNAVGGEILSMSKQAVEEVEKNFEGLVIANQGDHFSAGANLMLILMAIMEEEWDEIDLVIRMFQRMTMGFRYSAKPVVAAPFGMTLGGGCEICLHVDQVTASAETYMGLVEFGVGLIPAGGGTKEMLVRAMDRVPDEAIKLPFLRRALETMAMAKVATSGWEARALGFLRHGDTIVVNRDHQIEYAKQAALGLARAGYRQPRERTDVPVTGRPGMAAVKALLASMREGQFISEHDEVIASKLGYVLTGGNISAPQRVSERYLLDLEREVFLSLCGMRKTQERIKHILDTGKPLRN